MNLTKNNIIKNLITYLFDSREGNFIFIIKNIVSFFIPKLKKYYRKISIFYQIFYNDLLEDSGSFVLWIPVFFAAGILIFFSFREEPNSFITILSFILLSLTGLSLRKNKYLLIMWLIIFATIAGFITIQVRAIKLQAPILAGEIDHAKIIGRVSDIIPLEKGNRLLIEKPYIEGITPNLTPQKIRITAKTSLNNAKIGDLVSLIASLAPPAIPSIPGGYDFALRAYFEQIGAVGYSLSDIRVIEKKNLNNLTTKIANFRRKIAFDINAVLGSKLGNIASALMIGEYNGIDKTILSEMRIAGISHILSVSGMHLSLVVIIFFFLTRVILNLFYPYIYRLNVKKIAAYAAIIGSFLYLLISGMQVAAVRAFIMSLMIIIAVLIDRTATPMRSIAWAALVIMVFQPESVINPSFQMSFLAVLLLVAGYDLYMKYFAIKKNESSLVSKILFYFLSTILSSLIAGLATAPIALYHFNQYANYGVLANLIAVPITSFIIMPCVILAFIIYPFGLEQFALIPMGEGIKLIIKIAHFISTLPHAVKYLPAMPITSLLLIIIGTLWLALWNKKIRLIGILSIIIAIIIMCSFKKPDVIIDGKSKMFAFKSDEKLILSSKKISSFTKECWLHYYGQHDELIFNNNQTYSNFTFINDECSFNKGIYNVKFNCMITKKNIFKIIGEIKIIKQGSLYQIINQQQLEADGTYIFLINSNDIIINSVGQQRGKRIWTRG